MIKQAKVLLYGNPGTGKALPLDEPVLTINGFVKNKDLQVGDYVISEKGKETKILAIQDYPDLEMYKITFTDGSFSKCCKNHLWQVQTLKLRAKNKWYVKTTEELANSYTTISRRGDTGIRILYKYKIPLTNPVQFPTKEFYIEPYLLGYALGNGCFNKTTILSMWKPDAYEIQCKIAKKHILTVRNSSPTVVNISLQKKTKDELEKLGLMFVKSKEKFIPKEYLLGDIEQRKQLLAGLLDSDGTCKKNKARFSSTSKQLTKDIVSLIRSLGGKASISVQDRTHHNKSIEYNTSLRLRFCPFSLERKAKDYYVIPFDDSKTIREIKKIPNSSGRCILVENPTSLYITRGYTVTHNSSSIASLLKLKNRRIIYLVTERNALQGLEFGLKHYNINLEPNQLIYSIIKQKSPKSAFSNESIALSKFVKQSSSEAQQNDKTNMNKDKYTYFLDVFAGLESFSGIDYKTNEVIKLGNVGMLDDSDILVIDGLTPILFSIWEVVKGDRVVSTIADYATIQFWLNKLTTNLVKIDASVIMLAHADRKEDELEKVEKIRPALNAGNAITATYAGNWSETIYCYKTLDDKRFFAGKMANVETSVRDLPSENKLLPDFSLYPIFETK